MDRGVFSLSVFAFFASYLIVSIPFASALFLGEALDGGKSIRMADELAPELVILVDDSAGGKLEPLNCRSSGSLRFTLVPRNIRPNSRISGNGTYIADSMNPGMRYDVSEHLSCFPSEDLISSQEIECSLDIEGLISELPYCPLDRSENTLEINMDFISGQGPQTLSASRDIVITEAGVEPSLEMMPGLLPDSGVSGINCRTGSVLDIPVKIIHSEVLEGEPSWTFSVDGSRDYETLDCAFSHESWSGDAREDIYSCEIFVYNSTIPDCVPGEDAPLSITARSGDYEFRDDVSVPLYSEDLNLGLRIVSLPSEVECQAVSKEGRCIPGEPKRDFQVLVTGAPERLDVYRFSYSMGGDTSVTLCDRVSPEVYRYSCQMMLPPKDLEGDDPEDPINFQGSFPFGVTVETKFLNTYYETLEASSAISYSGSLPSEVVDIKKKIGESENKIKELREGYALTMEILSWLSTILCCCGLVDVISKVLWKEGGEAAIEEAAEEGIWELMKAYGKVFFDTAMKQASGRWLMSLLKSVGIGAVECLMKAIEKLNEKTIEKLEDFQETDDPESFDASIPCVDRNKDFTDYITCVMEEEGGTWAKCTAGTAAGEFLSGLSCGASCLFEDWPPTLKCLGKIATCTVIIVVLLGGTGGTGFSALMTVCSVTPWVIEIGSIVLGFVYMLVSMKESRHSIDLAQAQMEISIGIYKDFATAMQDWTGAFSGFREKLVEDTVSVSLLQTALNLPSAGLFIRSGPSVLEYNETVCRGDEISIEYELNKLNVTRRFTSSLGIKRPGSPSYVKTISLRGLNGTYGPEVVDNILGNPLSSGEYDFVLDYGYGMASYRLFYYNETCI